MRPKRHAPGLRALSLLVLVCTARTASDRLISTRDDAGGAGSAAGVGGGDQGGKAGGGMGGTTSGGGQGGGGTGGDGTGSPSDAAAEPDAPAPAIDHPDM